MIKSFKEMIESAKKCKSKTIAVAAAEDEDVLKAVDNANKQGLTNAILVGNKASIINISKDVNIDLDNFEIIDVPDKTEACKKAAQLVRDNNASLLMKGFVDTSVFTRAVLNKEMGLMQGKLLSHVGVLKIERFNRFFILSDTAINISPTLSHKVEIIKNSVKIAYALGNIMPKVAILCAVEKPTEKMPSTMDAVQLAQMNERDEIKGCIVGGPFALDNAVSEKAAQHKGIHHPAAGNADILIVPNIEAGNVLIKSMEYFADAQKAGIIVGAKAPIVLTSRASSDESKFNSIALAVLTSDI